MVYYGCIFLMLRWLLMMIRCFVCWMCWLFLGVWFRWRIIVNVLIVCCFSVMVFILVRVFSVLSWVGILCSLLVCSVFVLLLWLVLSVVSSLCIFLLWYFFIMSWLGCIWSDLWIRWVRVMLFVFFRLGCFVLRVM